MKSHFTRRLALTLLLLSSAALTGCATASHEAAGLKICSHTPWRYKHMNHVHTRTWDKDQKPLFPNCSTCAAAPQTGTGTPEEKPATPATQPKV